MCDANAVATCEVHAKILASEKPAVQKGDIRQQDQVCLAAGVRSNIGGEESARDKLEAVFKVGDYVFTTSRKSKAKYDGKHARIVRVSAKKVKVVLLDGPEQNAEKEFEPSQLIADPSQSADDEQPTPPLQHQGVSLPQDESMPRLPPARVQSSGSEAAECDKVGLASSLFGHGLDL